uniref:Uncharacterized protein n=1 Tax=Branchiostoma floridae TaxID=7739 RepID=C3YTA9_BRAFL|eukprot:XP_002600464.1 hypothetical protein BRAFLDRAFT_70162 [Branchiostoma floridae]
MATEATSIEWDFLDNGTAMFNDTAGMPHVMRGPSPEFLAKAAKFNLFYNIMTYFILVIEVPPEVLGLRRLDAEFGPVVVRVEPSPHPGNDKSTLLTLHHRPS